MRNIHRLAGLLPALLLLGSCSTVLANRGAAELSLDRAAVLGLITLALPEPQRLELAGVGSVTLRVSAPETVHFRNGGIEAVLPVSVPELGLQARLDTRYVPAVEPLTGTVQLVPESVEARIGLPFELDLTDWIGAVDLPRRLDWELQLEGGRAATVTCFVQGVKVVEDRLQVELGLVSR